MKYTGSCGLKGPAKLRWITAFAGCPGRLLLKGAETMRRSRPGSDAAYTSMSARAGCGCSKSRTSRPRASAGTVKMNDR